MKIGLSFLPQIRSLLIPSPNPEQLADLTSEDRALKNGGGWIAQQVQEIIAQISTSFGREHNDDDTHSTINASGTIAERGRSFPLGEMIPVPYLAANFTGSGTMTWTVDGADVNNLAYAVIGKLMFLAFNISATSVGGALSSALQIAIPGHAQSSRYGAGSYQYADNGVAGAGAWQVSPNGTVLQLFNASSGNWTASANNTTVVGTAIFEVTGI